jgi:hypothetical protein
MATCAMWSSNDGTVSKAAQNGLSPKEGAEITLRDYTCQSVPKLYQGWAATIFRTLTQLGDSRKFSVVLRCRWGYALERIVNFEQPTGDNWRYQCSCA